MNYAEKLKDPRWQKKRLEILERDDWSCQCCGDKTNTLHVHHITYFKQRNPWEYQDENFITYCESCHNDWHTLESMERLKFLEIGVMAISDNIEIVKYLFQEKGNDSIHLIKCLNNIIQNWNDTDLERKLYITNELLSLRQFI